MTVMPAAARLDAAFAALADPTRRAILLRLVEGEATVNELAEPFEISQPAISRHLKVLEDAELIVRRVDGARRPCALAAGALDELDAYLGKLRDAMETNYSRLDQLLARAQSKPTTPKKKRSKKDRK
jgi:DNA-binding transcriptional ArsR family regulator